MDCDGYICPCPFVLIKRDNAFDWCNVDHHKFALGVYTADNSDVFPLLSKAVHRNPELSSRLQSTAAFCTDVLPKESNFPTARRQGRGLEGCASPATAPNGGAEMKAKDIMGPADPLSLAPPSAKAVHLPDAKRATDGAGFPPAMRKSPAA